MPLRSSSGCLVRWALKIQGYELRILLDEHPQLKRIVNAFEAADTEPVDMAGSLIENVSRVELFVEDEDQPDP